MFVSLLSVCDVTNGPAERKLCRAEIWDGGIKLRKLIQLQLQKELRQSRHGADG